MPNPNNGQPVPPAGYKLDVKPPAGYVPDNDMPGYGDVPAFLQQGLDMGKVRQVVTEPQNDLDRNATAKENSSDPYKIQVLAPDLYGPPILNHELTHTYQDTRAQGITPASPVTQSGTRAYSYGGVQGLQAARMQGKTVSDFNPEQQADMVKDYKWEHDQYLKKAASGKITPADEKRAYDLQQAYHPFIRQLAGMPGQQENLQRSPLKELLGIQKPVAIDRRPTPPGLPSYDTPGLGVLPADPLMGGKSQSTVKSETSPVLQRVLKENPGLAKNFNSDNTSVVFADPKRSQRGLKERGGLEFWSPDDKGDPDFPHPSPGKNVLEIYSSDLKNNPQALKQAVYGDLMHGMSSDPYWNGLRTEFMKSFTPQEIKRQERHQTWWDDVNGSKDKNGPTYDAYLRGWIANEGQGRQGQEKSGNTMYSPKQIQILQKMQDYLKTGKPAKDK